MNNWAAFFTAVSIGTLMISAYISLVLLNEVLRR